MEVKEASVEYLPQQESDCPPGYKQTEVGVIPEDWDVINLSDIGETIAGLTYTPSDVSEYGLLVLRASNVQDGRLAYDDNVYVDMDVPSRVITKEGDILICVRNGSRQLIGKCALIDEKAAGSAFGAFMSVFRSASSGYAFYQFQHSIVQRQIRERLGATINQITNRDMSEFLIPLPPTKAEQEAIATALSDTDALIESLEQLIAKKRHIKQGAMQELLTGKRRLPGFSGEWESKLLGQIADIDPENLPGNTNPNYRFNYISLEQVDEGRLLGYSEEVFLTSPSRARRVLRNGDVLMATVRPNLMAHLHYTGQVDKAICSTGFAVLRAKEGISDSGYLFFHLFCFVVNKQIEKIIAGSNYPAINGTDVKQIEIPCPPSVEEQSAIANILSDMDTEIAALETRLAKTRQLKQGMMHELLTGRIRLVKPGG